MDHRKVDKLENRKEYDLVLFEDLVKVVSKEFLMVDDLVYDLVFGLDHHLDYE